MVTKRDMENGRSYHDDDPDSRDSSVSGKGIIPAAPLSLKNTTVHMKPLILAKKSHPHVRSC